MSPWSKRIYYNIIIIIIIISFFFLEKRYNYIKVSKICIHLGPGVRTGKKESLNFDHVLKKKSFDYVYSFSMKL